MSPHNKKCASDRKSLAHFFNPGYEHSIAVGNHPYTAPRQVRLMRNDLATLPLYLAPREQGDWAITALDAKQLAQREPFVLAPWGWAPELLYTPLASHVPYGIEEMKLWASRERTRELVGVLRQTTPHLYPSHTLPIRSSDTQSLEACLAQEGAEHRWVIKEEFSSSGRGIVLGITSAQLMAELQRRGNTRQELYVEHLYDKVCDRGYEFWRNSNGKVRYLGPSDFNVTSGRYLGNRLRPAEAIEADWATISSTPSHSYYVEQLREALEQLTSLGRYEGAIGVDTIVYRNESNGSLALHPAIEVNVRPTMGLIALRLSEHYLPKGSEGKFTISYYKNEGEAYCTLRDQCNSLTPLYAQDDSSPLSEGIHLLTPLTPSTHFVALLHLSTP